MDPDEAHYAQLTREMLHAGNWMMPLLDGLPYIDKPVLFHWLQGLAIAVLGETELAMRLPSAIAAIALFWITRWTGEQLFDMRIGVRGVADAGDHAADVHARQHRRVRHGVHRVSVRRHRVRARLGAPQSSATAIRVVRAPEPGGDDQGAGGARACRAVFSGRRSRAAETSRRRCCRCAG